MHKGFGAMEVNSLIALGSDALNPRKQYYTLLNNYKQGDRDSSAMRYLAINASSFGESESGRKIGAEYATKYLIDLKEDQLYTRDNLSFLAEFLQNSKQDAFQLFYHQPTKIDDVMGKGYAEGTVDYIISKEEIDPILLKAAQDNKTPKWSTIREKILRKFSQNISDRNVLAAQVRWYGSKGNWPEYTKRLVVQTEKYGRDFDGRQLNNVAWQLFLYSNNKNELNKAINWAKKANEMTLNKFSPAMDTYANLLYKSGNIKDALEWEQKALDVDPRNEEIQDNFDKMKKGLKTWLKP